MRLFRPVPKIPDVKRRPSPSYFMPGMTPKERSCGRSQVTTDLNDGRMPCPSNPLVPEGVSKWRIQEIAGLPVEASRSWECHFRPSAVSPSPVPAESEPPPPPHRPRIYP